MLQNLLMLEMFPDLCRNAEVIMSGLNHQKYATIGDGKLRKENHV
jgi:hypothetical protein